MLKRIINGTTTYKDVYVVYTICFILLFLGYLVGKLF